MSIPVLYLGPQADRLDLPTRFVGGAEAVRQRLRLRLGTWQGSWLLDRSVGVPYQRWFEGQTPPLVEVEAELVRQLVSCPGVARVRGVQTGFDPLLGELRFSARVELTEEAASQQLRVDVSAQQSLTRAYVRISPVV